MAKASATEKYDEVNTKSRKDIFIDNFVGGLSWGVGSIIGATIIIGVLGFIITQTRYVPIVGDVVEVVIEKIQEGRDSIEEKAQPGNQN